MTVQVQVEKLVDYQTRMVRALGETGVTSGQLNEIFSRYFRAECGRCGINISGDELMSIAIVDRAIELPHPKLERLRLGYCARDGCESVVYWIHLEDYPGIDWEMVNKNADHLSVTTEAAAKEAAKQKTRRQRVRSTLRLTIGLGTVVLLIVVQFVMRNGHLPFVKKQQKYQVDPASNGNRQSR